MSKLRTKKIICTLLALVTIVTLFAGCGAKDANEKRAEEIASNVLSSTAQQRKKFSSVEILADTTSEGLAGASGVIELYKEAYGEHLTDECIETMLQNRAFPVADTEFFANCGDITAKEIKLTKSAASENSFDYSAKLFDGDNLFATASGSITFADANAQKAERITVNLTK